MGARGVVMVFYDDVLFCTGRKDVCNISSHNQKKRRRTAPTPLCAVHPLSNSYCLSSNPRHRIIVSIVITMQSCLFSLSVMRVLHGPMETTRQLVRFSTRTMISTRVDRAKIDKFTLLKPTPLLFLQFNLLLVLSGVHPIQYEDCDVDKRLPEGRIPGSSPAGQVRGVKTPQSLLI